MRTVLGMTGYCRPWILGYATMIKPLQDLTKSGTPEPLPWSPEAEQAFVAIKQSLSSAPALGLPDYAKPFTLFCHERNGFALAVLTQRHGDKHRPIAYYSTALDAVAAGFPPCLRAVAAAALAVQVSESIVLGSPLIVAVPHAVAALLLKSKTQHLSTSRLTKYELVLLSSSHITLARCPVLNPASLLPGPKDGDPHDCVSVTSVLSHPRDDLLDVPLQNPDLIYFVDGSCLRDSKGKLVAGYAVCSAHAVIESAFLPSVFSAQVAELVALTRACILAQDQAVTIYTDSRYAFGVVHDYGLLWKYRGFLTSTGSPIKNSLYVSALLDALLVPKAIAVVKCTAHQTPRDEVTRGNALADSAAKAAALSAPQAEYTCALIEQPPLASLEDLAKIQEAAPAAEKRFWSANGCILHPDHLWHAPAGRLVAPKMLMPYLARVYHGMAHVSKGGMVAAVNRDWCAFGFPVIAHHYCQQCVICQQHNIGKAVKVRQAAHPPPWGPFVNIQIDFIQLSKCCGYEYVLVLVDVFSNWVEAFPCRKADARTVVKLLLKDFVPRFGIPVSINSDRGTHFTGQIVKELCAALQTQHNLHCPHHPQSAGTVERQNGILKNKLAKICAETNLKWPDALPLALMSMRATPNRKTGLSPHEILTGRPMRLPTAPPLTLAQMDIHLMDDTMLKYCQALMKCVKSFYTQVKEALPKDPVQPCHSLEPGDWVYIKVHQRKTALAPRWKGPFQVLLTTNTAVKCQGLPTWTHASHCKKPPPPGEDSPAADQPISPANSAVPPGQQGKRTR
ncbi:protein NYNRIN-like [Malaclemys terrapin pileata]|uniref:protein NYNRIN-like n=1 Tax=Malaclemys terrapin pileata TaxID=2991368 RepID=UPI0023A7F7F5|nr:protein NYNRIN-like [Malaclemys terrapin pileata]XP_053904104.1 protein NYNRIN-like [Malaclemys terrapin pileata]XP_053904105.1 protein NYNRIN-like [Malaclemys terrapin pileata]